MLDLLPDNNGFPFHLLTHRGRHDLRTIPTMFCVLLAALIADMVLATFFDILQSQLKSNVGFLLFVPIVIAIFVPGYYLLFGFLRQKSIEIRSKAQDHDMMYVGIAIVQLLISSILAIMVLQITLFAQYYIGLTVACVSLSYGAATVVAATMSYRLFLWYYSA